MLNPTLGSHRLPRRVRTWWFPCPKAALFLVTFDTFLAAEKHLWEPWAFRCRTTPSDNVNVSKMKQDTSREAALETFGIPLARNVHNGGGYSFDARGCFLAGSSPLLQPGAAAASCCSASALSRADQPGPHSQRLAVSLLWPHTVGHDLKAQLLFLVCFAWFSVQKSEVIGALGVFAAHWNY